MRKLICALVIVATFCLAANAEAGPLRFVARCAKGACGAVKNVAGKTRFADGDGQPLRRSR